MAKRLNGFMVAATLALAPGLALAGDDEVLISLDRQWGEASLAGDADGVAVVLADDVVAISETGIGGKAEMLADTEPAPEGAAYEPTDYKVAYLDDKTAVMTHSTAGPETHHSLHVWVKRGDAWKVVASATVPAAVE